MLRLTDLAGPFAADLSGSNTVGVYLNLDLSGFQVGDVLLGGFYTDNGADFLDAIGGASFEYYVVGDGNGSHPFGGVGYYRLSEFGSIPGFRVSTVPSLANFAGGDVSGYVMQLTVVPEPAGLVLFALGALGLLLRLRWRKKPLGC